MMLGTISTILAATIVNVAFPALIAEFGVGHDTLQWVAAGFLAATTATMLTTAWLIETFGERATFVGTMSLFLAASLLAAASWNPPALIVARVLQGTAAGILQPLAMVVLFRVFPVEERGRAMALYGFGIVLAPAIGPALGGVLLEAFGWRSIFLLTVPFCIAALVLGARTLRWRMATSPRIRFDWIGCLLLCAGLALLLNVAVVGHRDGFASARALALAATGIALAAAFIGWEIRSPAPLLPIGLFRHRPSPPRRSSRSRTASGSSARRIWCRCSRRISPTTTQHEPATCSCRRGWRSRSRSRRAAASPTGCKPHPSSSPGSRSSHCRACC